MSDVAEQLENGRRAATPPMISVIVAAYNERRYIEHCLRALWRQTYPSVEVIVVDDGSRDGTGRIAASFPGVRVFRQPHRGAGTARNLGAQHARGQILAFIDGDMVCPPPFLEQLVAPMIERGVVGTFTKEIRLATPHKRWARAHLLGRGLSLGAREVPDRWENFRAIWRADFIRVGGFDEIGYGEDVTLGRKLGALAEAVPGAVCYHFDPDSLLEVFRTARWYGRGGRITENPRWRRRYTPGRILRRAVGLAVQHRAPSLFVYRVVWDVGVLYGWRTRARGPMK